jgi:hypothetical protein
MTMNELYKCIKKNNGKELPMRPEIKLSSTMKTLLQSFLEIDPVRRISWKEFFNHEIFSFHNSPTPRYSSTFSNFQSEKKIPNRISSKSPFFEKSEEMKFKNANQKLYSHGENWSNNKNKNQKNMKIYSTKDIFKNAKKNYKVQNKHFEMSQREKFHSQKNTPKIQHERFRTINKEERRTSQGIFSTNTHFTEYKDYGEKTTTRQNLFERNTKKKNKRFEYSQELSPWSKKNFTKGKSKNNKNFASIDKRNISSSRTMKMASIGTIGFS